MIYIASVASMADTAEAADPRTYAMPFSTITRSERLGKSSSIASLSVGAAGSLMSTMRSPKFRSSVYANDPCTSTLLCPCPAGA